MFFFFYFFYFFFRWDYTGTIDPSSFDELLSKQDKTQETMGLIRHVSRTETLLVCIFFFFMASYKQQYGAIGLTVTDLKSSHQSDQ